jgi:sigma-B regulation protein RsbU (phosphoserine phosphatase)
MRKAEADVLLKDYADGAEYQLSLMPSPPEIPGYEIGLKYRGARQISGDFYDFLQLDVSKLGIMIADASGKGIPASFLTMTTRAMLHAQPEHDAPPGRVLCNVNRMLQGSVKRGMFVTGIYAILDTSWHTLTVANAGHLPLVVWRSKARIATIYPPKGAVLGVAEPDAFDAQMREDVVQLEPGDRFVMFTDGVNEAMAPGQKEFGMEHLRKRLMQESDSKSTELLRHIMDAIDIHRGGGEQSDDITIITGRRLP